MGSKKTSGRREIGIFRFSNQKAEHQIVEASQASSSVFSGNASLVFVKGHISAIMQAIFNAPVGAGHLKELVWSDFFSGQAGNTIHDLFFHFTGFGKHEVTFQFEDLLLVGPIQEVLELAAHRESTLLDASMTFIHALSGFEVLGQIGLTWDRVGVWSKL